MIKTNEEVIMGTKGRHNIKKPKQNKEKAQGGQNTVEKKTKK
jgi:hypothetical protein